MYSVFFHALAEQIILSHKLPVSAHCSVTAAEEQSRGAGGGMGSAGHPGEQELWSDAAFEFHTPFGVTQAIGKTSISCQRISTICKVEK